MTVIRPNSISGINSITGNGGDINLFRADGTKADIPIVNNITAGVVTATTFSGNITGGTINATSGTVTGNLGVGGVLTYEDVTNIDSVGVITARSGIRIGATGANTLITGNADGIGIKTAAPSSFAFEIASPFNDIGRMFGPNSGNLTFRNGVANEVVLHTGVSDALIFGTNGNNERIRIGTAGQVGIAGANYGSSGQVLTSAGSGSAVQWATPSSGLSHAQQWRLGSNGDLTANTDNVLPTNGNTWAKQSASLGVSAGTLGSDMTYDGSGVFAFPVTGIWKIEFYGYWGIGAGDSDHNLRSRIQTTVNNSSYTNAQESVNSIKSDSTYTYQGFFLTYLFDVTSTSNCKCRFILNPSGSNVYYKANTSPPMTGALFMRLGDT